MKYRDNLSEIAEKLEHTESIVLENTYGFPVEDIINSMRNFKL